MLTCRPFDRAIGSDVLSGLARVLGLEFATFRVARLFTKVEFASFNEVILVVAFEVGVLVIPGMFDGLHEALLRVPVRHVGRQPVGSVERYPIKLQGDVGVKTWLQHVCQVSIRVITSQLCMRAPRRTH